MITDENDKIIDFEEKPAHPRSTLASMGIYIFSWPRLRELLVADMDDPNSDHDFGKNIIPTMLKDKRKLVAYTYNGYWKDVGTIASLHQANMDLLLSGDPEINIYTVQGKNKILSEDIHGTPQFIGKTAKVKDSLINQGSIILGEVNHSVISGDVIIEEGAKVTNSVVMNGAFIDCNAEVTDAIIGPNTLIEKGEKVNVEKDGIALIVNEKAGR